MPGFVDRGLVLCCALLLACGSDDNGPPDGAMVTFSFCQKYAPIWVAVQDGDAPWVRLDPISEGQYESRFNADRGGVAYVSYGGGSLIINYGNLAELGSIGCVTGAKHVDGTMAGLSEGDDGTVTLGGSFYWGVPYYQLEDVADRSQDLLATRLTDSTDGSYISSRIVIRRNQNPAQGTTMPVIDFEAAEAFAPSLATVSAAGAGDAYFTQLVSGFQSRALPAAYLTAVMSGGPAPYAAVPVDRLESGDINFLTAITNEYPDPTSRTATAFFRAAADRVLQLGPNLVPPVVTIPAGTVNRRPRLQLPSQAEYGRMVSAVYQQYVDQVAVTVTAGYLGGTPAAWDLTVPDLSAVDGWNNAWGLGAEPEIGWRVEARGGVDAGLGDTLHDGDTAATAQVTGGDGSFFSRAPSVRAGIEVHRGGFPQPPRRGEN